MFINIINKPFLSRVTYVSLIETFDYVLIFGDSFSMFIFVASPRLHLSYILY